MNVIARMREGIKSFYASYDVYIRPVLKFALAVLIFIAINDQLGYMNALNNLFVILILAVICAILPLNGIVVIGTILIVAHCFGLGLEVGGFALILYIVMALLYFRFVPKDAIILLLAPVAFRLDIPLLIPLTTGLLCGPVSAISVVCGLISWQFIHIVSTSIEPMKNSAATSLLDVLQTMPQELVSRDIILMMITFVVIMLVVTVIRKLLSSHSWEIAIIVGSVLYVFLMMTGSGILETEIETSALIFGTVVSALAALLLEFFFYNADYSGSEYLQFEDDKYYYHVKVVPKILPSARYDTDHDAEEDEYEEEVRVPRRRRRAAPARDEADGVNDGHGSREQAGDRHAAEDRYADEDSRYGEGDNSSSYADEEGAYTDSAAEQNPADGATAVYPALDRMVPTDATIPYSADETIPYPVLREEPAADEPGAPDGVTDETKQIF